MTRFLTLGVEDEHGHLAGALTLHTAPNIPALPECEWGSWLQALYGRPHPQAGNKDINDV